MKRLALMLTILLGSFAIVEARTAHDRVRFTGSSLRFSHWPDLRAKDAGDSVMIEGPRMTLLVARVAPGKQASVVLQSLTQVFGQTLADAAGEPVKRDGTNASFRGVSENGVMLSTGTARMELFAWETRKGRMLTAVLTYAVNDQQAAHDYFQTIADTIE